MGKTMQAEGLKITKSSGGNYPRHAAHGEVMSSGVHTWELAFTAAANSNGNRTMYIGVGREGLDVEKGNHHKGDAWYLRTDDATLYGTGADQAEQKAKAQEAIQILKATIPNWSDDLYQEIGQYAVNQGISQDEYDEIVDPRLITVLHKSMLFDGAKVVTQKKIKSPKKTLSGSKYAPKPSNQKGKKAMQRLRKTGSMEDALEAYMNR